MASANLDLFDTSTAMTITQASITNGSSQQSDLVTNSTSSRGHAYVLIIWKFTLGTSPTAGGSIPIYLIRGDGTSGRRDDGAGATDASITIVNANLIAVAKLRSSPATGDVLQGSCVVETPGPEWGVAFTNNSGVALNGTGGNHYFRFIYIDPEQQ